MSNVTETFRAMGCEVVVAGASAQGLQRIHELFELREQMFSRFRADSELSRVNASTARVVRVSPLFAATLRRALVAARQTQGLVDPTLGAALEAAGYDRDLGELCHDVTAGNATAPGAAVALATDTAASHARSRLPELRLAGRLLSRPVGLRLDLNGVVKALAVDDALTLLDRPGLVSAGGDLAVRGPAVIALPQGAPASAFDDGEAPVVLLERGAMATSGTSKRAWLHEGVRRHHLLDPSTGVPAESPWQCVTVVAGSCHHADVGAKAALLAGDHGPAWLDARGLAGRFLGHDGAAVENGAWRAAVSGPRGRRATRSSRLPHPPIAVAEEQPCS